MPKNNKNVLNVIDLFSGCGGFSYGFQMAGFNILLGVDNTQIALDVFKNNHLNSDILNLDLSEDTSTELIANKVKGKEIDVIIAGPPCQGFSLTGTRNENDKRNKLFYSVFKLAKKVNPKIIIIENVPGLATLYNGKAKEAITDEFDKLGYDYKYKVLYAPDYGVPQIRKRLVFVGIKKGLGIFDFPSPTLTPAKYISCEEAISDLQDTEGSLGKEIDRYESSPKSKYQKFMRQNSNKLYNHVGTKHTPYVIDVISKVPNGGNYKDLPPGIGESRKFNEARTRYHSDKPSKTIDTGHRNHFHYKYNRVPTVRENARLQSFPDNFIFTGTKTQQYRMVGNAVPPLLGYILAESIKKILSNK